MSALLYLKYHKGEDRITTQSQTRVTAPLDLFNKIRKGKKYQNVHKLTRYTNVEQRVFLRKRIDFMNYHYKIIVIFVYEMNRFLVI